MATCPDCGKVRYYTRKDAKQAARRMNHLDVRAYKCGAFWHLGHLPGSVTRGNWSRARVDRVAKAKRRYAEG